MSDYTVYLDNAATTKPAQAVIDAVAISLRDGFYNPSAIYKPAVAAAKEIENCRMLIMDSL